MRFPISLKSRIVLFKRLEQALGLALLLAAGIFYRFAYRPHASRMEMLQGLIGQDERELETAQRQERAMPAVQADIDRLNATLADLKKIPTTAGDLGPFEMEIDALARRNHLTFSFNYQGTPVQEEQFWDLPINLKFYGDCRNVYAFLCGLQELPRLTRVRKMSIESPTNDGSVQVEMTLDLYYVGGS